MLPSVSCPSPLGGVPGNLFEQLIRPTEQRCQLTGTSTKHCTKHCWQVHALLLRGYRGAVACALHLPDQRLESLGIFEADDRQLVPKCTISTTTAAGCCVQVHGPC